MYCEAPSNMTMANGIDTDDYESKLGSFNEVFVDLIKKYKALQEDYRELSIDHKNERRMRRQYQEEVEKSLDARDRLISLQEDSAFVLGLIDGDGVYFQDTFLKAQSGSEAASKLQAAIRDHVSSLYPKSSHWRIMVNIYVSLDKMGQKLAQVGLLNNQQEFRLFAQDFNVNQPLFSIIDVGYGKERADFKINEMLRTFSENPTCKHIIFGGCHDAGYLNTLGQYKHHKEKAAKLTLLHATSPYPGFLDLPFNTVRFDDVFRTQPLPESGRPANPPSQAMPERTLSLSEDRKPAAAPSPVSTPAPAESTWRSVAKSSGPINGIIDVTPYKLPKKRVIYLNKEKHRLDEKLPALDPKATQAIDKRMKEGGSNLCNQWHLNNHQCPNGDFCRFQHGPPLTAGETIALQLKARNIPCRDPYCTNVFCYLGHQCAWERDQGYCTFKDRCNFVDTHGMDKTKFYKMDEDGKWMMV
ncbi:uncharacterized protein EI97DRAFT_464363 [Westerdykella ornata]|uniref:C3H1-type domain-containing protein n=1 Tax=Westerdykella ornata TaxID=318751 RepID=A0A6A6JX55_WESOR|nr:uncharacterized protein EI97DRAFT_464363 [Westerdykella ornata]KAF2280398.1 hypothetical protein EI97DRAFT_464363 [Westerdykella ornata]